MGILQCSTRKLVSRVLPSIADEPADEVDTMGQAIGTKVLTHQLPGQGRPHIPIPATFNFDHHSGILFGWASPTCCDRADVNVGPLPLTQLHLSSNNDSTCGQVLAQPSRDIIAQERLVTRFKIAPPRIGAFPVPQILATRECALRKLRLEPNERLQQHLHEIVFVKNKPGLSTCRQCQNGFRAWRNPGIAPFDCARVQVVVAQPALVWQGIRDACEFGTSFFRSLGLQGEEDLLPITGSRLPWGGRSI